MNRRRRPIPLWAFAALVAAAIAWQFWHGREVAAPQAEPPSTSRPAQPETPSSTTEASPLNGERHDLSIDERRGGHTLARHVGRSDAQLRDRLARERNISAASTYTDRATAERVVALALKQQARRVDAWLAREGNRPNLAIDYRGSPGAPIGRSLTRGRETSVPCFDALVVLRWDGRDSYVLTSYPEIRR